MLSVSSMMTAYRNYSILYKTIIINKFKIDIFKKVQVYYMHQHYADCTIASTGHWACHYDTKLSVCDTFKSATQ